MEKQIKIEDHPEYLKLKSEWDRGPKLKDEFIDFENFFYYKAEVEGLMHKSLGGGR